MAASITVRIFPLYGLTSPYSGYRYGIRTLVEITTSGTDAIASKSLTVTYGGSNISGSQTRTITVPANSTKKLVYNEFKESRQGIYSDFGGYVTVSASTKLNSGTSLSGSSTVTWPTTVSNITNYGISFPTVNSTLENPSWTLDTKGTIVVHEGRGISDYTYDLTLKAGSKVVTILNDKPATFGTNMAYTPPLEEFGSYFSSTETQLVTSLRLSYYTADGTEISPFANTGNVEGFDYVNVGYLALPASVRPTIASVTPSDVEGFRDTYGVYLGTKSILQASVEASGIYGSTITKVAHQIDNLSVSTTDLSTAKLIGQLNQSGSRILKTTVTDSRGRTAVKDTAITVVPYVPPSISLIANRWDTIDNEASDGSDTVRLDIGGNIPSINGHLVEGTITVQGRQKDAPQWTVISTISVSGTIEEIVYAYNQSVDSNWDYRVILTDSFGTTVESADAVGTATPILEFHSSGKGLGIGTIAPEVGLDVGMQADFKGTAEDGFSRIRIVNPEGTEAIALAKLAGSVLELLAPSSPVTDYDRAFVNSHVYMRNNLALGWLTSSNAQTTVLKMNKSNQVEFNWTSGGLRGRVMKLLWSGALSSGGSVTIADLPYYNVFGIVKSGSIGIGFKNAGVISGATINLTGNNTTEHNMCLFQLGVSGTTLSNKFGVLLSPTSNAYLANQSINGLFGIL